jgi:hypothetical protein
MGVQKLRGSRPVQPASALRVQPFQLAGSFLGSPLRVPFAVEHGCQRSARKPTDEKGVFVRAAGLGDAGCVDGRGESLLSLAKLGFRVQVWIGRCPILQFKRPERHNVGLRQMTLHRSCASFVDGMDYDNAREAFLSKVMRHSLAAAGSRFCKSHIRKIEIVVEEAHVERLVAQKGKCLFHVRGKDSLGNSL